MENLQRPKRKKRKVRNEPPQQIITTDVCEFRKKFIRLPGILQDETFLDIVINSPFGVVFDNENDVIEQIVRSKGSFERLQSLLSEWLKNTEFKTAVDELFYKTFGGIEIIRKVFSSSKPEKNVQMNNFFFWKEPVIDTNRWKLPVWKLRKMCEYFFRGNWNDKDLEAIRTAIRRKEEKEVMKLNSKIMFEDISFLTLSGVVFPLDIVLHIISFIERGAELLNLACVSEKFMFLVFSFWKDVKLRNRTIMAISLLALRGATKLTMLEVLSKDNVEYLLEYIQPDKIQVINSSKGLFAWFFRRGIENKDMFPLDYHRKMEYPCCHTLVLPKKQVIYNDSTKNLCLKDCKGTPVFPNIVKIINFIPNQFRHFKDSQKLTELKMDIGHGDEFLVDPPVEFFEFIKPVKILTLNFLESVSWRKEAWFSRDTLENRINCSKLIEKIGQTCYELQELSLSTFMNIHPKKIEGREDEDKRCLEKKLTISSELFRSVQKVRVDSMITSSQFPKVSCQRKLSTYELVLDCNNDVEFKFLKDHLERIDSNYLKIISTHWYDLYDYGGTPTGSKKFSKLDVVDLIESGILSKFNSWFIQLDLFIETIVPFIQLERVFDNGNTNVFLLKCDLEGFSNEKMVNFLSGLFKSVMVFEGKTIIKFFTIIDFDDFIKQHCNGLVTISKKKLERIAYPFRYVLSVPF